MFHITYKKIYLLKPSDSYGITCPIYTALICELAKCVTA